MDLDMRCTLANKFSLASFTTFLGSSAVLVNNIIGIVDLPAETYAAAIPFLISPTFWYAGMSSTRDAYIESRRVIEEHGRVTSHLENRYDYYCGKTGINMAVRDLTREGILNPKPSILPH